MFLAVAASGSRIGDGQIDGVVFPWQRITFHDYTVDAFGVNFIRAVAGNFHHGADRIFGLRLHDVTLSGYPTASDGSARVGLDWLLRELEPFVNRDQVEEDINRAEIIAHNSQKHIRSADQTMGQRRVRFCHHEVDR
jgi:hypothetical protein